MPVDFNAANLANITDLSQLKLGKDGELSVRNKAEAFFRRVGDAFLKLSQSGRAQIAARNDKIVEAMKAAVQEARTAEAGQPRNAQSLSARLNAVTTRLANAAKTSFQSNYADIKANLNKDARFKAMPQAAQENLLHCMNHIARSEPVSNWAARMSEIQAFFLNGNSSTYDINTGLARFAQRLVEGEAGFKAESQQNSITTRFSAEQMAALKAALPEEERNSVTEYMTAGEMARIKNHLPADRHGLLEGTSSGIHESLFKDAIRGSLGTVAGKEMPAGKSYSFYDTAFRDMLRGHEEFLPFVSMMATQAGLDSALSFLPGLSGSGDLAPGADGNLRSMPLMNAGLTPTFDSQEHKTNISFNEESQTITIEHTFAQKYNHRQADEPGLKVSGSVTMTIALNSLPQWHENAAIPDFILSGSVGYEAISAQPTMAE